MVNFLQHLHWDLYTKFGLVVAPLLTVFGGFEGGLTLGCVLIGIIFPGGTTKS